MLVKHLPRGLWPAPAHQVRSFSWAVVLKSAPARQRRFLPTQPSPTWPSPRLLKPLGRRYRSTASARSAPASRDQSQPAAPGGARAVPALAPLKNALQVLESPTAIPEEKVLEALKACEDEAKRFSNASERSDSTVSQPEQRDATINAPGQAPRAAPGTALLFHDEDGSRPAPTRHARSAARATASSSSRQEAAQAVSDAARRILQDPKIFLTPAILKTYTHIQILIDRPQTLPEAFHLYAHKPAPNPDTNPVTFRAANPDALSAAVPLPVATAALDAALRADDMNLALDVMEQTVGRRAFRRRKAFALALPPAAGLALAPVAFWQLAGQAAAWQSAMPLAEAHRYWFWGLTVWFYLLAGFGGLSVTTINRKIDRVAWEPGTLFHARWAREEERAMLDRIANHWGFKDRRRRGEEEGPEWEALRDYCGMREMVLDMSTQMDDME